MKAAASKPIQITNRQSLITRLPLDAQKTAKAHHVVKDGKGLRFRNPWSSFSVKEHLLWSVFKAKFVDKRPPFVPVPQNREGLVNVRKTKFGPDLDGFKVTWIGHASFVLETSRPEVLPTTTAPSPATSDDTEAEQKKGVKGRGVRILCDPVWSERTSPVTFMGPKRYTPTPCSLDEMIDLLNEQIDLILISHNHYDHADTATLSAIYRRCPGVKFLVGLNNSRWLISNGIGRQEGDIIEMDWWDQVTVEVKDVGRVKITCCPTQHDSARSTTDRNRDLWCSFAIEELLSTRSNSSSIRGQDQSREVDSDDGDPRAKKLFFAGDTGYRTIPTNNLTQAEESGFPVCPTFKQVGDLLGPFDLALLPIGLCSPRMILSKVHANAWDSINIHRDVRSKRSVGMHWGTVRGGLSQDYEDVKTPPAHWRMAAKEAGLEWNKDIGLMEIGETVIL